jgi:CHASE2 domain-containing sensor protein
LGIGEALVSTLQDKGIPMQVQRVLVRPPHSRMGKATVAERKAILDTDRNMKRYGKAYDPRSAHEELAERTAARLKQQEEADLEARAAKNKPKGRNSSRQTSSEAFFKSMVRSLGSAAGSSIGRKLFRGLLGSLLK